MVKTNLKLLCVALLVTFALSAPKEEEVHLPIGGYVNHKWYSGNFTSTQDILISQQETITTYFLILNVIPIMTQWCSGLMEDLDVLP